MKSTWLCCLAGGVCLLALVATFGLPISDDTATKRELESLSGKWMAAGISGPNGKNMSRKELEREKVSWTFKADNKAVFSSKDFNGNDAEYIYRIDPSKSPKTIDLTYVGPTEQLKGFKQLGIYKIENGKLSLCLTGKTEKEEDRPKEFAIKDKAAILLEMERAPKK